MRLKIDAGLARQAVYLSSATYEDERRYYDLAGNLIVCRNGLELVSLAGLVVDAEVGWDVGQPGFVLDEKKVGRRRSKVTVFRVVEGRAERTLRELIAGPRKSKAEEKQFLLDVLARWLDGKTEKELAEITNRERRTVNSHLRELEAAGKVEKRGRKWLVVRGPNGHLNPAPLT